MYQIHIFWLSPRVFAIRLQLRSMFKNIHFLFSLNYESNNLAWNRVKCSIQVQWFIVSNIFCIVFFRPPFLMRFDLNMANYPICVLTDSSYIDKIDTHDDNLAICWCFPTHYQIARFFLMVHVVHPSMSMSVCLSVHPSVQCQYRNTIQIKLKVKFRPELDEWWLVEGQIDENIE